MNDDRQFAPKTISELLLRRAEAEKTAFVFLEDGEREADRLSYAELAAAARETAGGLRDAGLARGDRVLLSLPSGRDFIVAFLGCLHAGIVAIPAFPPGSRRSEPLLAAVGRDARPGAILTIPGGRALPEALAGIRRLTVGELRGRPAADPTPHDIAFLQFTSGSTSAPKGVVVGHDNLLHNQGLIRDAFGGGPDSTIVGWLPMHHDMGLIGNVLHTIFLGATCVLMTPGAFLERPARWLRAVSTYRADISGGPNFAFDLCLRAAADERLDLSAWRVAFNGAEPINPATLDAFSEVFGRVGFRREAFRSCYGLAEATLFVAGGEGYRGAPGFSRREFNADRLERAAETALRLVPCGFPAGGQRLAIVDPTARRELAPGRIGEIWVAGPSVARGYWNNPAATRETFQARLADTGEGPFLRTGDLGGLRDGQLFVTGRIKDLVVIRGVNHSPHDIEETARSVRPEFRACAAFPIARDGVEELAIVLETTARRAVDHAATADAVRRAIARGHEVTPAVVALVAPGGVPKTTSGKIRRGACRAAFIEGRLGMLYASDDRGATALTHRDGSLEDRLVRRIADAAGVSPDAVDRTAPIADLGLDSIRTVELCHALAEESGAAVAPADLSGSVEDLAGRLPAAAARADATAELADSLPQTHNQRALFFLHRRDPRNPADIIARAFRFRGRVEADILRRAFEHLADAHPALRATFYEDPRDGHRQATRSGAPFDFEVVTLTDRATLADRLRTEAFRPFDPTHAPPVRARLFRLDANRAVLLFAIHHIIADLWTLTMLARELGETYGRLIAGESPTPNPDGYARYVAAETAYSDGAEGIAARDRWKQRLAGVPPVLALPHDRPVPGPVGRCFRMLSRERLAALKALAKSRGTTPFAVLLAVYGCVLARYAGQRDIVVGVPYAGRERIETRDVAGYLVNLVPVVLRLAPTQRFADLVAAIRVEDARVPFPTIVSDLGLDRTADRPPLVQATFAYLQPPAGLAGDAGGLALGLDGVAVRIGPLECETVGLDPAGIRFELALAAAETANGLALTLDFDASLFERTTADRFIDNLLAAVGQAIESPETVLFRMPLPGDRERRLLLETWNDTGRDVGPDGCLHAAIVAQARRTPDAPAVVWERGGGFETLTYRDLERRSALVAARLRKMGIGPERRVAVFLERSVELVVALLAVLRSGAAYVPLDPDHPSERLAYTVADARASVLVTRSGLADRLPPTEAPLLVLDREERGAMSPDDFPSWPAAAAYVIYTSGSTGKPKGAVNSHRAVVNRLHWMQAEFRLTPADRVLQKTPVGFDVSVWEFFWPLMTGAAVVLARPGGHRDPEYLADLIRRAGVTVVHFVPSMLEGFLPWASGLDATRLRLVACSGEALSASLRDRFRAATRTPLVNLYGPTEAAVDVTWHVCGPDDPAAGVPIGKPIANVRIYLLDERLDPVPIGARGEIHIGGIGVGRGYFDRPDLTADRFVPDPYAPVPGGRMYRTGDLGRFLPDGAVEYLGRLDDQVKIRGHRVEPGEIEAVLETAPGVRRAAVRVAEGPVLVAYATLDRNVPTTTEALRAHLEERLPDAMIPAAIVVLDEFPLGPNGKIDRNALPAPTVARSDRSAPPTNAAEAALIDIWADELRVAGIGIDDNFFRLGGDSIRALRVVARARERGLDLSVEDVLRHRTVRGLAAAARPAVQPAAPDIEPFALLSAADRRLVPDGVEDAYPLTVAQTAVIFQSEHGGDFEQFVTSFRVHARLDAAALGAAAAAVTERHPILRTVFDLTGFSTPVQLVLETVAPSLVVADEPEDRDAWFDRARRERPDWTSRPPARWFAHPLDAESFRLTLVEPLLDGWSVATLISDLLVEYARRSGRAVPLPEAVPAAMREYVALERAAVACPAHRTFWESAFDVRPATMFAADAGPDAGVRREYVLPAPETVAGLHALADRTNVPFKSVLLAAHLKAVSVLSGRRDVVTAVMLNGRPERPNADLAAGAFLNPVPVALSLPGGTWADLVRVAFETERDAWPYRRLPFPEFRRRFGDRAFPETAFNFTHFHGYRRLVETTGIDLSEFFATDQTYFPLTAQFNLDHASPALRLAVEYRTAFVGRRRAEMVAATYDRILAGMAAEGDAAHAAFRARPTVDRPTPPAATGFIHDRVSGWAERSPAAIAVEAPGEKVTYRELDHRAESLARGLRRRGVAPETVVGIALDRGSTFFTVLLAVWKAGGGALPLDPALPPDRLAAMVAAARPKLIVTGDDRPWFGTPTVGVDDLASDEVTPAETLSPENAAYIMFTSGSTGTPKGVVVPHRGLDNLAVAQADTFRVGPGSRVLQFASVGFDASISEAVATLGAGATLLVAPAETVSSTLPERLRETRATAVTLPPSMLDALDPADYPDLATVVSAGEACRRETIARWSGGGRRFINAYGPTEATVCATMAECRDGEPTIGKALPGVSVIVLDADGHPVPPGGTGEAFIGGIGLARGYLGAPDLTAAAFVPDELSGVPGARLYLTGDLVRLRDNGDLEFIGRRDRQLKIRGHRIEPGEIEAALLAHPSVSGARVTAAAGPGGRLRLVAYVVARGGDETRLRRFLSARLPTYMVPAAFVFLDAFPTNANGKIDVARLPASTDREADLRDRIAAMSDEEVRALLERRRTARRGS